MKKIDFSYMESKDSYSGPCKFSLLKVHERVLNYNYPDLGEHIVVEDFTGHKRLLMVRTNTLLNPCVVSKQEYIKVEAYKRLGEVTPGQIVKWPKQENYYIVSSSRNGVTNEILMYGINNKSCICAAPDSAMVIVVGSIDVY